MSEIFLRAVFAENLALFYFLGMCTVLVLSTDLAGALRLGAAVIVVLPAGVALNHFLYGFLLAPGAFAGFPDMNLGFLRFFLFAGVTAVLLQLLHMILARHLPQLHRAIGSVLPLVGVHCVLLGTSLLVIERQHGLRESMVQAIGGGLGWALAIAAFVALRQRLSLSEPPAALAGSGTDLFAAGLLATAFLALGRLVVP